MPPLSAVGISGLQGRGGCQFLGKPRKAGAILAWPIKEVSRAEQSAAFVAWLKKRRAWLVKRGKLPDHHLIVPLDGFPANVTPISKAIKS